MKDNSKTKIVTNWLPVPRKPPLWLKLWRRLLVNKKEETAGTHSADERGEKGELSKDEEAIIKCLWKLPGWQPADDDIDWLRDFREEFLGFDLSEVRAVRDYYSERPLPKDKGAWENRFRNWMRREGKERAERKELPGPRTKPYEECGFEPAGITTSALGMDGLTRYEFEFRVVSLDKLIVSHDPFTFIPNPQYPKELQPRLRERAATKIQVEKIAANLEPDAVLTDFHTLDRGAPIIGSDMVVEAGNGRVMGIMRATKEFPYKYSSYKDRLRERIRDFGLRSKDVDTTKNPILVRVRVTDVDRTAFTQEANSAATIAPSAIENARTDAQKITTGMLQELVVGENQSLEDALRSPRNQAFANRFLKTLPENVQASLVDAQGYLNRDGVHRMAMAVFVSVFQGDTGLRLAEKAFESIDMDVRTTINAIARSLGSLAQAEALIRSGDRDTKLSIGDDLAQAVAVYSAIKRTPELTVEKYLAQGQLLERELTDFQEKVLVVFDKHRKSPKKLGTVLNTYAQKVISQPPPAQAALIPGAEITKEQLWDDAVRSAEVEVWKLDPRGAGTGEG